MEGVRGGDATGMGKTCQRRVGHDCWRRLSWEGRLVDAEDVAADLELAPGERPPLDRVGVA